MQDNLKNIKDAMTIIKKSLEIDNIILERFRKYNKYLTIFLIVNLFLFLPFLGNRWGVVLDVIVMIICVGALFWVSIEREKLLIMRIKFLSYMLRTSTEMGYEATGALSEKLEEVYKKYHEKKSRLEDLVGPDFEDEEDGPQ